tara:strand:- start:9772 stop:10317 length:546 start_codon:yes stop_codon:yes gene_type:complete
MINQAFQYVKENPYTVAATLLSIHPGARIIGAAYKGGMRAYNAYKGAKVAKALNKGQYVPKNLFDVNTVTLYRGQDKLYGKTLAKDNLGGALPMSGRWYASKAWYAQFYKGTGKGSLMKRIQNVKMKDIEKGSYLETPDPTMPDMIIGVMPASITKKAKLFDYKSMLKWQEGINKIKAVKK